jgi:hypothetical protein
VASFGGRVIAAVAVWLGLAMLDLGPRATAAFLPALSPPTVVGGSIGSGAGALAPTDEHAPAVWPPVNDSHRLFHQLCQGLHGSTSGGAGAPSTGSSAGPSTPALGADGQVNLPAPDLVTRFHAAQPPFILTSFAAAIFEPPRAGH